jgi:DNA invertase Pin-like site-specific DNA recombinase
MIAAIYARKSSDQSAIAEEARSVSRQVEHAREYAARKGWTVDDAAIYVDDGVSGAEFANRPGYVRLLNTLKPRAPFNVLIVSELSRLGREQLETGYAVKQLSQAGVRIVSYLEDREILLDTPTDKFLLAAINFAAEIERDKARQRVTDAMARRARQGHVCGGDCFGYHNVELKNADGRRSHVDREINEAQAEVVRRIFRMCAAGYGLRTITKQLNAEGLPSPRPRQGRPRSWTPSTVRTVLYRDLYRGSNVWNKRRKSDAWGQRACRPRPESEWIRADVPHLRIVTDAEWHAAHKRMDGARRLYLAATGGSLWGRPPSELQSQYLLSGLMRCACCGASMTVRSGSHGLSQRLFYICASYDRRGRTVCDNGLRLPMAAADDAILTGLSDYVMAPVIVEGAVVDAVAELQPAREMRQGQRAALQAQIRKLEQEQARFVAAIAVAGKIDALARALRDNHQQRAQFQAKLMLVDNTDRVSATEANMIENEVRARLEESRELFRRQKALARQIVSQLLEGRIVWMPRKKERLYEFAGRTKFALTLKGTVFTHASLRQE